MKQSVSIDQPYALDNDSIVAALETNAHAGLSSTEALQRLHDDGPNALRAEPRPPAWRQFLLHFQDPLVYLLIAAAAIGLIAWFIEGRAGAPVDTIVITAIIILNAILSYVQEVKAENAVAALTSMTAAMSSALRDGKLVRVPTHDLVRGDLLSLSEGDIVGADARLVQASALRVQEASLTGESEAVLKDTRVLREPVALADRTNMVFKGTTVVQGNGLAIVTATGMATEIGAIASMLDRTAESQTPLQKEIGKVGKTLGTVVALIAVLVVATVLLITPVHGVAEIVEVLLLGVSLAVAAVPEGLPAILSIVLALGVQRMARQNAVVKKLSSVEALGSATVIASDKTGTLTRAEMTIERIITASGTTHVSGIGYAPKGEILYQGERLEPGPLLSEHVVVLCGGSLASNADLRKSDAGQWEIQGDPTEAAFLVAEEKLGAAARRKRRFERIGEIPFSSERKLMSTLQVDHEDSDNIVIVTKGAPDVLLQRCSRVRIGSETVLLDDARRQRILADIDSLSDAALRTLAVAYRSLKPGEDPHPSDELEQDLIYAGTVGIIDPAREEAALAIREARHAGIRVLMITGDHPRTAARIAADLGITAAPAPALTGLELERMDQVAFASAVRSASVFARVAPEHKLRIVDTLQADGNVVAMTGDGVNDAPALKSADIGIAMGITGTEVTKQAARMILADDNFATIVRAVREGRHIFDNIRKFLRYLLSSNIGEVLTIFLGVVLAGVLGLTDAAGGLVLPLLATQILWINLLTDSGPALAMGMDPETDDVMARPPRRRTDRIIDAQMWASVLQTGFVMAIVTLLTIDFYLPGGLIEGSRDLDNARTAGFTVLVLAQLYNCFNARSDMTSAFHHLFANKWLWGAIAFSLLLQIAVVHLSVLNTAFSTTPLDLEQWVFCGVVASTVLWASELRKRLQRARRTHLPAPANATFSQ